MNTLHRASILVLAGCLSTAAFAAPSDDPPRGTVNAAAIAQAVESAFDMTIGGRLQTDFSFPLETEPFSGRFGELDSDIEVRRVRIHLQGRMYERIDFKMEVDFAGGEVSAKDLYVGLRGLPVSTRFGHFKEPLSLEELTSSRHTTFMERSLVNALVPSRNTGIRIGREFADARGGWDVGVFRDTDGFEAVPGSNYGLTGRVTYAPVLEAGGARVLHLGAGVSRRWIEGTYSLGVRPGDHLAPKLVSVALPADGSTTLSLEGAANFGALGFQGEYLSTSVNRVGGGDDPRLHGFYVQATYFLTGEHRPYDGGTFGRVIPNADLGEGGGAWELAARYSRLDLTDARPAAGEISNLTLGANWYWYPHFRWMFNYELADVPGFDGENYSSFHLRTAIDF